MKRAKEAKPEPRVLATREGQEAAITFIQYRLNTGDLDWVMPALA